MTPRKDGLDKEVVKCNQKLASEVENLPDIYLVTQSNLRENNWSLFKDVKHIKQTSIAKYAGNLKVGIRKAMNNNLRSIKHLTQHDDNRMMNPNKDSLQHRLSNLAGYDEVSFKQQLINKIVNAIKDI